MQCVPDGALSNARMAELSSPAAVFEIGTAVPWVRKCSSLWGVDLFGMASGCYERYSPFFLVRHVPEISFLALVATLAGISVSYFLSRNER